VQKYGAVFSLTAPRIVEPDHRSHASETSPINHNTAKIQSELVPWSVLLLCSVFFSLVVRDKNGMLSLPSYTGGNIPMHLELASHACHFIRPGSHLSPIVGDLLYFLQHRQLFLSLSLQCASGYM
jgi:hypothetical protein